MIRIANAPCSWGVIENVEGETARLPPGPRRDGRDRLRRHRARRLGLHAHRSRTRCAAELDGRGLALMGSCGQRLAAGPRRATGGRATTPSASRKLLARSAARTPCRPGQRPVRRPVPRRRTPAAITPEMGLDRRAVEGLRRRREPRRPAGPGRGRHPDGRPPAHRHAGSRPRPRSRRLLRHDRPRPAGPVPRHRALDASAPASDPVAAVREFRDRDLARPLQGRRPGRDGRSRARRGGTASSPSATACSASWARAAWTSRACSRRSRRSTTTAGSSWSRTSCRAWATRGRARGATASTCGRSASRLEPPSTRRAAPRSIRRVTVPGAEHEEAT